MKTLARVMASAMVLTVVMAFAPTAFAADNEHSKRDDEEAQVRYIVSCPSGGKHSMEHCGLGYAYYGAYPSTDLRINAGAAYQCRYCNLVLITQNDAASPYNPSGWGTYTTQSENDPISRKGTVLYTTSFRYNSSVASDPFAQGFEF